MSGTGTGTPAPGGIVGMRQAAERLGVRVEVAKRALRSLGVELIEVNRNILMVRETDLDWAVKERVARNIRPGRPRRKTQDADTPTNEAEKTGIAE